MQRASGYGKHTIFFLLVRPTYADAGRIEPLLYGVIIQQERGGTLPKGHTSKSPPLETYAKHVRHLLLGYTLHSADVKPYLSLCPNLFDLALWTQSSSPEIAALLGQLSGLERLSTNIDRLFGFSRTADFCHPLFANITHLEITNPCEEWEKNWCGLALIPKLTHLAFDFEFYEGVIVGALEECKSLELLVLVNGLFDPHGTRLREASGRIAADPRVVAIFVDAFAQDWENGARGKGDFWTHAEEKMLEDRGKKAVRLADDTMDPQLSG